MTTKALRRPSARERLLSAADELFYEEGIHTVGIDRVLAKAEVAKGSLYYIFGSKDELVRGYLEGRGQWWRGRVEGRIAQRQSPRSQILSVFDTLEEIFAEPTFKGCAFVNAAAEAQPGSTEQIMADEFRRWVHQLFSTLSNAAGAKRPKELADSLVLLYDGANVGAQMDKNPGAARAAREVAARLVDAAVPSAGH